MPDAPRKYYLITDTQVQAAKAHWPYLTEIVIMRVSAIDEAALAAFGGLTAAAEEATGAAEAEQAATAGTGAENAAGTGFAFSQPPLAY